MRTLSPDDRSTNFISTPDVSLVSFGSYTLLPGQSVLDIRSAVEEPSRIRQMLFGGFQRCLYPVQKFESGTERRLALILERDSQRWFRPASGQFQIYYKLGSAQPEYVPDFVAEMEEAILMVETKARDEMKSPEVDAKAEAAAQWCAYASSYSKSIGSKAWTYLLVPHDQVNEAVRLRDLFRFKRDV